MATHNNYTDEEYEEMERQIPSQAQQVQDALQRGFQVVVPTECSPFVGRCLRLKDGNVEKTLKLIQAFHALRSELQGWNVNLKPSLYSNFYKNGFINPLLPSDSEGRQVSLLQAEFWNPKEVSFEQAIACVWMLTQYLNANFVEIQRKGIVTVWDFTPFSLRQAWAVKTARLLVLARWIQNGITGRLKAIHIINHPRIINVIYAAIKPFINEKLKNRIHFHSNNASLLALVSSSLLPGNLGGSANLEESRDNAVINQLILEDDYFENWMRCGFPLK